MHPRTVYARKDISRIPSAACANRRTTQEGRGMTIVCLRAQRYALSSKILIGMRLATMVSPPMGYCVCIPLYPGFHQNFDRRNLICGVKLTTAYSPCSYFHLIALSASCSLNASNSAPRQVMRLESEQQLLYTANPLHVKSYTAH